MKAPPFTRSLTLLPLLWFSAGAFCSDNVVLVRPSPTLPPVVGTELPGPFSVARARAGGIAVDAFVGTWVNKNVNRRFKETLTEGLRVAQQTGQKGALLQISIVQHRNSINQQINSPLGASGVGLVGVGPDANAVCFLSRCYESAGPGANLDAAKKMSQSSGYYWVEPRQGVLVVSRFSKKALEDRAEQLRLMEDAGAAYTEQVRGVAIDDLARELARTAKSREEKAQIAELLTQRETARKELDRIVEELRKEMLVQADKAADAKALSTLAGIVSTAQLGYGLATSPAQTGGESSTTTSANPAYLADRSRAEMLDVQRDIDRLTQEASKVRGTWLGTGEAVKEAARKKGVPLLWGSGLR